MLFIFNQFCRAVMPKVKPTVEILVKDQNFQPEQIKFYIVVLYNFVFNKLPLIPVLLCIFRDFQVLFIVQTSGSQPFCIRGPRDDRNLRPTHRMLVGYIQSLDCRLRITGLYNTFSKIFKVLFLSLLSYKFSKNRQINFRFKVKKYF